MKLFRAGKSVYLILIALIVLGYATVGFLQSRGPALPEVREVEASITGDASVLMIVDVMRAQLEGFGGWLPNDLPLTPGWMQDNLPNFQLGVLQVVRHTTRVLRDNLTRQRTSDAVHKQADLAYSAYANDPLKWAFPSAEGAFGRGNGALLQFRGDLGGLANFYPRADNLIQLLEPYISELGAVTSVLLDAQDSDKVSWMRIDDNFYYAKGVGYAALGMMLAVRQDFDKILTDKNATEITDLILQSLRESQFEPWLVTNGSKNGVLANHSNNLKVYLDDARQKMKSLVSILDQG